MKRKILILVLTCMVVLTMAVPSFAIGPSYCAIGDSLSAGCKSFNSFIGLKEVDNPGFLDFNKFDNGLKNTDVYAVPHSFTYKVATELNADKDGSFNGSYVAMRSKDICHILGIPAYKGDSYKNDAFNSAMNLITKGAYTKLFSQKNKGLYEEGIARADYITIELGENDLAAFFFNDADDVVSAIGKALKKVRNAPILLIKFTADYNKLLLLVNGNASESKIEKAKETVLDDLYSMKERGLDTDLLKSDLQSVMKNRIATDSYYEEQVVKYVREKNQTAKIVVTTEIDPYKDMNLGSSKAAKWLVALLSDISSPLIKSVNAQIMNNAGVYKYEVADISAVSLNPPKDKGGAMYMLHPNKDGQEYIAKVVLSKLCSK